MGLSSIAGSQHLSSFRYRATVPLPSISLDGTVIIHVPHNEGTSWSHRSPHPESVHNRLHVPGPTPSDICSSAAAIADRERRSCAVHLLFLVHAVSILVILRRHNMESCALDHIERFLAVVHPIQYKKKASVPRAVMFALIPWVYGFLHMMSYLIPLTDVEDGTIRDNSSGQQHHATGHGCLYILHSLLSPV